MGANDRVRDELQRRAAGQLEANRGRMTHFEIFPTLLELMGFDRAEVRREFGPGLFDIVPARERRFFSGDPFQSTLRMLNDFD